MDLMSMLRKAGGLCTGCEACRSVCPHSAIEMEPDQEGFLYPRIHRDMCVDCGLCGKICPVLHTVYSNRGNPASFAMMASDEERAESSSGAFVPMVAKWVLGKQGVVYGAAWTKGWGVHHIAVETEEDLGKIRGSKYVQGRPESCYQEAKEHLASGRWVLYTGLPCQIAGLYAYLGNRHPENLVTIDILCHGAPSYKVFRRYLDENYDVDNLEHFAQREKSSFGWAESATAYLKDGTVQRTRMERDPFFQAFNPVMIMRLSCAQCPMSRLPRQGDFTTADFWGVERFRSEFNDGRGTSAVLVNNEHAEKIVGEIRKKFKLWAQVPLDYITHINVTILHPLQPHSGRKHFFSILDRKPFHESVERGLHHKYDIGIVGLWYGINYGSIITYYALYILLRSLGYDSVMLPKPNRLWEEYFNSPDSIAQRFIWKHCNVFIPRKTQEEFLGFNNLCRDFVVGSDVVWMYSICGCDVDQFFFLDWVKQGHKKIAYAASLGNGLTGPDAYVKKALRNLLRFDAVSCRESSGAEMLSERIGRNDISHVLDPVFLCDVEVYLSVIGESKRSKEKDFVFAYGINPDIFLGKWDAVEEALLYYDAELKLCANPNEIARFQKNYENLLLEIPMEDWLWYMKNCSFYLGDSYHALCFSLIFHKPFIIAFPDRSENSSVSRFESLLGMLGLQERLLVDFQDEKDNFQKLLRTPIDWKEVDEKLHALKKESMGWLVAALEKPAREITAEECIDQENLEYRIQLQEQERKIADLTHRIAYMNQGQVMAGAWEKALKSIHGEHYWKKAKEILRGTIDILNYSFG